jgi:hypothetical protein
LAVRECVPTDRLEVVSEAAPLLKAAVPRETEPSKNCTVPVAVPPPLTPTLAVKVIAWPTTDGLADEVREVDVVAA